MVNPAFEPNIVRLQKQVMCPHCWHGFAPEDALWITQSAELVGDPRLGPDYPRRFLPMRFNVRGDAIDSGGQACTSLACPNCHLEVPRAMFELSAVFFSILGAPASGKSYLLAAMTWQLRQSLTRDFGLSFSDADPASNRSLNEYEELLFLNSNANKLVAIRKTELQGELYDTVLFGEQVVSYPRPFIFGVRPLEKHPNYARASQLGTAICLYDNAGEHFYPGQDTAGSPVTRHIAHARVLFFLFDPTQDPRFRKLCAATSKDPQLSDQARTSRQETILHEAADRVRRYTGLAQHAKHSQPLVVIVTKYDAWSKLLPVQLKNPWAPSRTSGLCGLRMGEIKAVSASVRQLLWQHTPEIVSTAETFAKEVYFLPVSATGTPPEVDAQTGMLGIRPGKLRPVWAEVPMLFALAGWGNGLIPYVDSVPANAPATG
jgi:hypothetical protein